jgi:hypothetical protein
MGSDFKCKATEGAILTTRPAIEGLVAEALPTCAAGRAGLRTTLLLFSAIPHKL